MAYRESACTDVDQIPGLVATFAASLGWGVQNDGSARVLRRPVTPGLSGAPTPIKVETVKSIVGANPGVVYEGVAISRQGLPAFLTTLDAVTRAQFALVRSPWLSSGAPQPFIPKPTKLHCMGSGAPEPFLAFVIEFGFNVYRPFYIGTLDGGLDLGTGEVIACASGAVGASQVQFPISPDGWNGMFSGRFHAPNSYLALAESHGGVFISGKNDSTAAGFSRFGLASGNADPQLSDSLRHVFGGPRDGVDDALLAGGFSPFSGDVLLTAINLFTAVGSGTQARAAPLGSIRGVRGVNMRLVEPGSVHDIGNQSWRVFPQLRKNLDSVTRAGVPDPTSSSSNNKPVYPVEDTSWYWGLAFLEGEAA